MSDAAEGHHEGVSALTDAVAALTAENARLRAALQRIRHRHEAEDTGRGFVRGEVAWAMWQDAVEALEAKEEPRG